MSKGTQRHPCASWLAALAVMLFSARPVAGDQIVGTVRTSGSPVPNARVILFDASFTTFVEARASWRGTYQLDAPSGSYRLGASARDLAYVERGVILAGGPVTQDFDLGPETE